MQASAALPLREVDLWAPVPLDPLPRELVLSLERQDWGSLRDQLRDLMYMTDGPYGRALHQFVRQIPIGIDPVFDQYRAACDVDFGDWNDLRRCLESGPIEPREPMGLRDVILAPIGTVTPPAAEDKKEYQTVLFWLYEARFQYNAGAYRRLMRRMLNYLHPVLWERSYLSVSRYFRYRRLQDAVLLGCAEAQAGTLGAAIALARAGQRLGDEGEPVREFAFDLERLAMLATNDARDAELRLPSLVATRASPLAVWEFLFYAMPFLPLLPTPETFDWAVRHMEQITAKFGSPRGQFISECWRVARQLDRRSDKATELPAIVAQSQRASPGLRAFAQLLAAIRAEDAIELELAERLAASVGNVWMQCVALVWLTALNPTRWSAVSLRRLLIVTGWRRLPLVPPQIAADAALGLVTAGLRGPEIVELAVAAGRPNVTVDVAQRHVEDSSVPASAHDAAVIALATVGTVKSRELMHRLSRRSDEIGRRARALVKDVPGALSDREAEVIDLAAHGLTNRAIAERLVLSPHTIARHLANARQKLGAANRAEAAAKLAEMTASH